VSALAWAVVALPAAGAATLPFVRRGDLARWGALGVAGLTLALAAALPWRPGVAAGLRVDALAAHLGIMVALAGLLGAWLGRAWTGVRAGQMLAVLAGVQLAMLADSPVLAWIGLEAAVLALLLVGAGGGAAAGRALRAVLPALALALLGGLLLAARADLPPGWLSLGWILLLAGLAPLVGLAPLHGWARVAGRGNAAAAALLPALGAAALLVLLRGREVAMAHPEFLVPGPALLVLGMASLGWAALSLWRGGRQPGRDAVLFQAGLATIGFGLGGPAAMAAGLLLLSGAVLLGPLALAGHGRPRAAALAGLALLPPFASFGAGLALLVDAADVSAWLALGLAGLMVAGAGGIARAAWAAWQAPWKPGLADIPAALVLALCVAAGVLPGVARWFALLAEAL
jgi:hypothetical protein